MRLLILVPILLASISNCKTSVAQTSLNALDNKMLSVYETVNGEPQFADNEDHFMVYWAVWRQLSQIEKQQLALAPGGVILSLRDIHWSLNDCRSNNRMNIDGEKVWYFDELEFDDDRLVKPIKEAPRPGYRYFSMLNLHSQHLRGAGPWVGPKKERGETMEQWDIRRHKAYLEWLHRSWAKGTRGQLFLTAEHRIYRRGDLSAGDKWILPKDYPHLTGEALQLVSKYSPRQWPVYFDERAHKPHSFVEPESWLSSEKSLSHHKFRMRLDWNWCDVNKPVVAEIFVPRGEMPPAGPNRPGRTDSGENKIKVTEIDWP